MIYVFITFITILILGGLFWVILELRKNREKKDDSGSLTLLLQQMNELGKIVDDKMTLSQRDMREAVQNQFSESQRLIHRINDQVSKQLIEVAREMSEAKEANKQVFTLANQLQDLEKVLRNQKTRGALGEMGLELILGNMLSPDQYQIQYSFNDGKIVDAIIHTQEGIIPVDAKFSMDNYRRLVDEENEERRTTLEQEFKKDLKKRIDETAQYIRPNEGTLPFAFMFIPAEGIYYDLLVNEVGSIKSNTRSLIDYAYNDKKVIIVSPTTFSAYLQSVLYGFKAFKIEKDAQEIRKNVDLLGKHLKAYEEFMNKLGNSLSTSVNHYNRASKEIGKIDKDITKITGGSPELDTAEIDRPVLE